MCYVKIFNGLVVISRKLKSFINALVHLVMMIESYPSTSSNINPTEAVATYIMTHEPRIMSSVAHNPLSNVTIPSIDCFTGVIMGKKIKLDDKNPPVIM